MNNLPAGVAAGSCDRRRRALILLLAGAGLLAPPGAGVAHTPFRQWVVYRRKHLLVGASKSDPAGYETARQLVAELVLGLPESRARPARAPDARRLAGLLTSDQLPLVLLRPEQARALRAGRAPFADYGPYDLRLVAAAGEHWLVTGVALPEHHAWQVSRTLLDRPQRRRATLAAAAIPLHAGSAAFVGGDAMPAPPTTDAGAADDEPGRSLHAHH